MPQPPSSSGFFNQSASNILNVTDTTLPREDSLADSIDSTDAFLRKLHRRSSILKTQPSETSGNSGGSADESYKRLPLEESFKRLPLPSGGEETAGPASNSTSYKRLPGPSSNPIKALKEDAMTTGNESCKRLPSVSRRNSLFLSFSTNAGGASSSVNPNLSVGGGTPLNEIGGDSTPELKRQASVSGRATTAFELDGRPSLTKRPTFANTSGGDLLRLSSLTRRNSMASSSGGASEEVNSLTSGGTPARPSLARKNSIVSGLMKAMRWTEESEADKKRRQVKSWEDIWSLYKKGSQLGKGAQGTVFRGTRLSDGLPVVIKLMDETGIKPWNMVNKMPVSAYLLRLLHYPEEGRVNPLFPRYIDHFHLDKDKVWVLVTEYQETDWLDLFDYIRKERKRSPLSEGESLCIFGSVSTAVSQLHALGFTHSDIKENNVLVNRETLAIQLIDLCSCREIPTEPITPNEFAGTLYYAAPEVRTGNFFSPESQDIYATGVLLLILLFSGKVPGPHLDKEILDPHSLSKLVKESDLDISSVTIKFLQNILSRKETKRPGILDLVDFAISAQDWAGP